MSDVQLFHEMAKGLAEIRGISEDQAIKIIRGEYTANSELHLKLPQTQPPYPQANTSFESTRELLAKGNNRSEAAQAGSQATALEMQKLELQQKQVEIEQRKYDAEQRRADVADLERKDRMELERERLAFEREQARMSQELRRDEMKLERDTTRADQKINQLLAMSQMSGKGSDGFIEMMKDQSNTQHEYFKEINSVKDKERQHTDQLRTDLAKIESERDVELAKLKAVADQNTTTAIDELVQKMDGKFDGMMKPVTDGEEDFLTQIEKFNKFQTRLTEAGLKTLENQGVDINALKKAHNITTKSEESMLDTIIGVGKDLYEKTIKPSMEDAAKNGSGTGTNAPSGLEGAFDQPDTELENRIRAEQEAQDQITLQEQNQLEQENAALTAQYENELYNKALQYNIPTHDVSLQELESMIIQYETIMQTPFNSARQTQSIVNMRQMASQLKINTTGKTVAQVDDEIIQTQQAIENQLDSLPDYIPGQDQEQDHEQKHDQPPESIEPVQESISIPVQEPKLPTEKSELETTPEPETEPKPEEPIHEEIIYPKPDTKKSPGRKRTVTAHHSSEDNEKNEKPIKKFTTSDGTILEGKSAHTVASKLAKELGGTKSSPATVELTDESGTVFKYETRMDEVERHGGKAQLPRAKLIKRT